MSGIKLDSQRRGDPFDYSSALEDDWVESDFPGGFQLTLRTSIPESSVTDDEDEGVVDKARSSAGEIVFSDTKNFRCFLSSVRTKPWPPQTLYWDFAGKVDDEHSYTLKSGTIVIQGDVTRSM